VLPIECNGWTIYFHPIFANQYSDMLGAVAKLKEKLPPEEYKRHNTVKLFGHVQVGIMSVIPTDPFGSEFALKRPLNKFCRLKKKGLPDRYRLFFKPYELEDEKSIIILWLGYPRSEGSKNDCYKVFTEMVAKGIFPENFDDLLKQSK
jgi:toxin YhaV